MPSPCSAPPTNGWRTLSGEERGGVSVTDITCSSQVAYRTQSRPVLTATAKGRAMKRRLAVSAYLACTSEGGSSALLKTEVLRTNTQPPQ